MRKRRKRGQKSEVKAGRKRNVSDTGKSKKKGVRGNKEKKLRPWEAPGQQRVKLRETGTALTPGTNKQGDL